MLKRLSAAVACAALAVAAPAAAQASAPAPAAESLGLEGSEMFGRGGDHALGYILLAAVLVGAVFAIIEFADDDDDDARPVSP